MKLGIKFTQTYEGKCIIQVQLRIIMINDEIVTIPVFEGRKFTSRHLDGTRNVMSMSNVVFMLVSLCVEYTCFSFDKNGVKIWISRWCGFFLPDIESGTTLSDTLVIKSKIVIYCNFNLLVSCWTRCLSR